MKLATLPALAACLMAVQGAADQGGGGKDLTGHRAIDTEKKFRGGPAAQELMGQRNIPMVSLLEHVLGNDKLVSELGLTSEQIAALRTASEDFRRLQGELAARQEEEGIVQARLLMGSGREVNEEEIMRSIERAGQARIEMAKARVRQLLVIRKTLTPEQMEKVRELIRQKMNSRDREEGKARWRQRLEQWRRREAGPPGPARAHTHGGAVEKPAE